MKLPIIFVAVVLYGQLFATAFVAKQEVRLIASSFDQRGLESPVDVVRKYFALAEQGRFEELRTYSTDYPDEYWDALEKQNRIYAEMEGLPLPKKLQTKRSENEPSMDNAEVLEVQLPDFYDKVSYLLIYEKAEYIKKVERVWTIGKEARVRLQAGSRNSARYVFTYDVLLLRRDDGWKVFVLRSPSVVNVYGVPESEWKLKSD